MRTPATFSTSTGIMGAWPDPPTYWSYSSLSEVEACPRRYALRRATYESVWDRSGYPDRVTESAIAGTAVHEAVETILRAFKRARCSSLADARAIDVLRELGGYTTIAVTATNKVLASLDDNPRMRSHVPRLTERLSRRTPEMRRAIQTLVSRMSFVDDVATGGESVSSASSERTRIGPGVHPEAPLKAEAERFAGRIDLLTVRSDQVAVLDFKTGVRADHHAEQLRLYGLLWASDDVANPDGLPVVALTVAYVDGEESVSVPETWDPLRQSLQTQIKTADQAVEASPPKAIPSVACKYCPVRQMCDEYWASPHAMRDPAVAFGDVEVEVLARNGPKSWSVQIVGSSRAGLLRTASEDEPWTIGQRLRVLDVAIGVTEDDGLTVATMTTNSEVFSLAAS